MEAVTGYRRARAYDAPGGPVVLDHAEMAALLTDRATKSATEDVLKQSLVAEAIRLTTWLTSAAAPLWSGAGYDSVRREFCEFLDVDGIATGTPGRVRVQACQIYAFAEAGRAGWNGPWRHTLRHGLRTLFRDYRRSDGGFRSRADDDAMTVEDQAFVLIALAAVARIRPGGGRGGGAKALLIGVLQSMRRFSGGYREIETDVPFQSFAHMRLLEAALAWEAINRDAVWHRLANEIVDLALLQLSDSPTGIMDDQFDPSRRRSGPPCSRRISPGSQFAWARLLETWGVRRGSETARAAASRLFELGRLGVDRSRGVVVDAMDTDFGHRQLSARLWPQTERLRAAALFQQRNDARGPGYLADAVGAARTLHSFLDTPVRGSWWDKLDDDGQSVIGPASSMNFYHIAAAERELSAAIPVIAATTNASAPEVTSASASVRLVPWRITHHDL